MILSACFTVESRCAMREGGAATQQRCQAGLHEAFGLGVDAGGGFVEDEQARIGEQGRTKLSSWRWP